LILFKKLYLLTSPLDSTEVPGVDSQPSVQFMDPMQQMLYYYQYLPQYANYYNMGMNAFTMPSFGSPGSLVSQSSAIQSSFPFSGVQRSIPPVPLGCSNKIVWVGNVPPDSTEKEFLVFKFIIYIYFFLGFIFNMWGNNWG
jgi:hypothetical protein